MCGIAGFTRFNHPTGDQNTLKAMGQAIYHRGPDAGGEYLDDYVGLCHRRLSILDLSEAGNQPMYSADGNLVIVFNGEIYNFQTLRDNLIAKGHSFNNQTDTEVLLALYQQEGEALVNKINGMFAFAIWDKANRTLFMARDRLGKKPIYYYVDQGYFVFASELKSLLTLPNIPRVIRPDAVCDFFTYQYVPDPKSIFENIFKLEPGHTLTITADGIRKQQYWDVSFKTQLTDSEDTIANQLLEKINDSTRIRMTSDVPLGAFLSGGIDSSGVVGLMAQNSAEPVTTCSIGFDSEKYDEVEFAKATAQQFKTNHHEFTVRENVADNLEKIVAYFDEPFADPSLVPTYFVSQLARQKVTVALAGDGGDECFAGYSKYAIDELENRLRNMFPEFIHTKVFRPLASILKNVNNPLLRKAKTLLATLGHSPAYGFYLTNAFFREDLWGELIKPEYKQQLGSYNPANITLDNYNKADGPDHLSKILYTDFKTYLPGDILVKVDRMSMANSLEVRAPLLDYQIVEFAAQIPSALKLHEGSKKHILKKAFSKLLTNDTLYRKKMGFSVPLAQWLREEIKPQAEKILFKCQSGLPDYFDMAKVRKLWNDHQADADNSQELWSMLMFQMWYNRYLLSNTNTAGAAS